MQIKTFEGSNLTQIQAQIKQEMGPDAIILNTETTTQEGKTVYKVMAALEIDQNDITNFSPTQNPGSNHSLGQELNYLILEWENFKESIFSLLQHKNPLNVPKKYLQAIKYMEKQGVKKEIILKLATVLSTTKTASLLNILKENIPVSPWPNNFLHKKIHFFLGPPGCGQTLSMLKMLLQLRKLKNAKILLAYPINSNLEGKLVLEHYANLIDVDFKKISPEDVKELNKYPYDYIFIDLPHNEKDFFQFINQQDKNTCTHIILSPVYDESYLKSFLRQIKIKSISSFVWTRLDESNKLGSIINLSFYYKIPISFLSYGSQLKNSSFEGDTSKILRYFFKRETPNCFN
ncbi:MAG: hypothetical protein Q9M37_08950 [Desulfonauticus sp.]|nr:hypothetical protein [Desulfonauticus sp.]